MFPCILNFYLDTCGKKSDDVKEEVGGGEERYYITIVIIMVCHHKGLRTSCYHCLYSHLPITAEQRTDKEPNPVCNIMQYNYAKYT